MTATRMRNLFAILAVCACAGGSASSGGASGSGGAAMGSSPAEIMIPGQRVFPESLTSSADGRIFIGSISNRRVYVVKPGGATAENWTEADSDATRGVFGVFADDKSKTLWACFASVMPQATPSALAAYDLQTGKLEASYPLPTSGAFCNDIAVGADGSTYVTDSNNMEVDRLKKGDKQLGVWAGNGGFGPKGGIADGIAIIGRRMFVNALRTNKVFAVDIGADGSAGPIIDIKLDRPIDHPDGMRSYGKQLLLIESGGAGRLARLQVAGGSGKLTTLKEGYPGGPVSVTTIGTTGYVLEGQLDALFKPDPNAPPKPFHATAVEVGPRRRPPS